MSEIKNEIKENADGSFTITDAHSTADIVRWLLTQDDKETILYLLDKASAQQCVCGEPNSSGTHRTDGPCLAPQPSHEPATKEQIREAMIFNLPLYTTPPQRTWVGLTDEEITEWRKRYKFSRALLSEVEAKLKEKNT